MSDEFQILIDAYLDDVLSAEEFARVNTLAKESPEFARRLAMASLLHDRLRTEVTLAAVTGDFVGRLGSEREVVAPQRTTHTRPTRRRWVVATMFTTAALVILGILFQPHGAVAPASAASLAIDQMIEAASRQIDRVYRIRITDFGSGGPVAQVPTDRDGVKPNVDGAELYVRGDDQFVLVRRFGDGTLFTTGSDGEIGWAAPPKGHVHLSRDVRRFRRAVPGERDDIPFLDLREGLEELRRDYDLDLVAGDETGAGANGWSRLDADKKPHVRGGAQRVQIWFDAAGTAHRIALHGLPQGEPDGSPHSVELELLKQRDVSPNFFRHEAHHDPGRPIAWE